MGQSLWRAVSVQCTTEPFKEVKAYPKLNSKHPLYGKLQFARTPGKEEAPIYFVLDESGEQPAAVEKAAVEKKEEKSTEKAEKKDKKANAKKRAARAPAAVKPSSYDRLYIDANRDGDLTNDPVVKPMKNPPWNLIPAGSMGRMVIYATAMARVAAEKRADGLRTGRHRRGLWAGVGVRPLKNFLWFTLNED